MYHPIVLLTNGALLDVGFSGVHPYPEQDLFRAGGHV